MQTAIKIEFNGTGMLPYTAATAQAIDDALVAVNGKAKRRFAITCPADVTNTVRVAEYVMEQQGVVYNQRDVVVTFRPAGPWMSADRRAISTEIVLKRIAGVWHLVSVDRVSVHPGDEEVFKIELADRAQIH